MSLLKTGLLQLSPESIVIGEVTYYDRGLAVVDRIDRESIAEALGLTSKVTTVHCLLDSSLLPAYMSWGLYKDLS